MKKIVTTFLIVLSFLSFGVSAELVHSDWKNEGDRMATLDTETGLEWLKVENTFGMSLNDVYDGLGTTFSGWRIASNDEISRLLMNSLPYLYFDSWLSNPYPIDGNSSRYVNSNWDFNIMLGGKGDRDSSYLYSENGKVKRFDVDSYWRTSYYELTPLGNLYGEDDYFASMGFFLVSDGGTTLSSQLDPSININNPDAPINQVSVPFVVGSLALLFIGLRQRGIYRTQG